MVRLVCGVGTAERGGGETKKKKRNKKKKKKTSTWGGGARDWHDGLCSCFARPPTDAGGYSLGAWCDAHHEDRTGRQMAEPGESRWGGITMIPQKLRKKKLKKLKKKAIFCALSSTANRQPPSSTPCHVPGAPPAFPCPRPRLPLLSRPSDRVNRSPRSWKHDTVLRSSNSAAPRPVPSAEGTLHKKKSSKKKKRLDNTSSSPLLPPPPPPASCRSPRRRRYASSGNCKRSRRNSSPGMSSTIPSPSAAPCSDRTRTWSLPGGAGSTP